MAILTKERLASYGNFVDFLERGPEQERRLILSLPETLLEVYCNLTNSYLPFDMYLGGELTREQDIRLLAREFLLWSAHIAQCRLHGLDISPLIDIYLPTETAEHSVYAAALGEMRQDLVETLTFLGTQLLKVAKDGNTLVIEGI